MTYAGKGPNTEQSSARFPLLKLTFGAITDVLWDGGFSNAQIDHAPLTTALKSNEPISEGMWVVDHIGIKRGLLLLHGDNISTIVWSWPINVTLRRLR